MKLIRPYLNRKASASIHDRLTKQKEREQKEREQKEKNLYIDLVAFYEKWTSIRKEQKERERHLQYTQELSKFSQKLLQKHTLWWTDCLRGMSDDDFLQMYEKHYEEGGNKSITEFALSLLIKNFINSGNKEKLLSEIRSCKEDQVKMIHIMRCFYNTYLSGGCRHAIALEVYRSVQDEGLVTIAADWAVQDVHRVYDPKEYFRDEANDKCQRFDLSPTYYTP